MGVVSITDCTYLALHKSAYTTLVIIANGFDVLNLRVYGEMYGEQLIQLRQVDVGRQANTRHER